MTGKKDNSRKKKSKKKDENPHASGHGTSGGHMGAGKSGKEGMGSEKPSDGEGMGSQKPGTKP